ncbi:MAG: methyltransferase domain-containing protein [Candidatus Omnitrophica bacterium]|nr:methyltransferase domain-containing protein [Candidatus Omnitrophota bacterium]
MIDLFIKKARAFPWRRPQISLTTLLHLYVRWFSCPFERLLPYIPTRGAVYDLGCGHGILLKLLLSLTPGEACFIGVDIDADKIAIARTLNTSGRLRYEVKDIAIDPVLNGAKAVILNDVLHLISFADQRLLLQKCHEQLSPDGILLIKEIERSSSWKFRWAYFQEVLVNHVLQLTRGAGLYYSTRDGCVEALRKTGFEVEVVSAHRGYPYSHIIYHCHKT